MLKKVANGLLDEKGRFYPFKTFSGSITVINARFPAKEGIRYFVNRADLSYSALVTDAGTVISLSGIVNREAVTLAATIHTTLFVWERADSIEVNQLTDLKTALTAAATLIVSHQVTVQYAEIDETPGEYVG